MSACHSAILETENDLQKAIDVIKVKGQNIASGQGKIATEGVVAIASFEGGKIQSMIEINSNTDFVSNSPEFKSFACYAAETVLNKTSDYTTFSVNDVE